MQIVKYLSEIMPTITADAHCDIPCGVYDPTPAKIAAKTVARMVQQLDEIQPPQSTDSHSIANHANMISRRIAVKEQHAELCKKELLILWTDFFKSEHLEQFPNLHVLFWDAVKLCSKNKQEVNADAAQKLVEAVDGIAKIFYEAKKVPERYEAYQAITDKLY
ncbi:MAG: superoxide dismutase, Ni [Candidatus Sungbacteria bacterium]|nr:superoxide dismutase, Ni [Candidatus Sungbacteria bacterium]